MQLIQLVWAESCACTCTLQYIYWNIVNWRDFWLIPTGSAVFFGPISLSVILRPILYTTYNSMDNTTLPLTALTTIYSAVFHIPGTAESPLCSVWYTAESPFHGTYRIHHRVAICRSVSYTAEFYNNTLVWLSGVWYSAEST